MRMININMIGGSGYFGVNQRLNQYSIIQFLIKVWTEVVHVQPKQMLLDLSFPTIKKTSSLLLNILLQV